MVFFHDGLIVADGLSELVVLDEEDVCHIELPDLVVGAEFGALSEQLLHLQVIFLIPVYLRLRHQHGNVLFQALVELLQRFLDSLVVPLVPRVLDVLRNLSQGVNVVVGQFLQPAEGFFRAGLLHDHSLDEF